MKADFWHRRWQKNEIGFHENQPNSLLVKHFNRLNLIAGHRIFLPLCGKSLDISWLLARGYLIVGAELSRLAIEQLFSELKIKPEITECQNALLYSGKSIDIFVGDIFDLSSELIGEVDAIYDRAALVALPNSMRTKYTKHLLDITLTAPQLLVTFEYDQSLMDGPPFSLSSGEVRKHYKDAYSIEVLESVSLPDGLRGKCAASEHVWLLSNKNKLS